MQKNITFSIDKKIIEAARKKALNSKTSLNSLFKKWLLNYVKNEKIIDELDAFLDEVSYALSGKTYTREELNER